MRIKIFFANLLLMQNLFAQSNSESRSNPAPPQSPSVFDASRATQNMNQSSGQSAQIVGTVMTTAGSAMMPGCCGTGGCCGAAIALVVMGGLASMQAGQHKGTAAGAGLTMNDTYGYGDAYDAGAYKDGNKLGSNEGSSFGSYAENLAKTMKGKNVPVTWDSKAGKFVLPDGKKIGPDDVGSSSAMSAAGLSASDIATVSNVLAAAEKKANAEVKTTTPNFGFEEGGGGGKGLGAGSGNAPMPTAFDPSAEGKADLSSLNAKAEVQGLTKNYNGEPIGVASDTIFGMMSRRYQLKDRQDSFFNGRELILQK